MAGELAIAIDKGCLAHDMGPHAPETPARLNALLELMASPAVSAFNLRFLAPRWSDCEAITPVHGRAYYDQVAATAGRVVRLDADCITSSMTFDAALRAAGAAQQVTDAVLGGARGGFALIRPPGHHAEPNRAMGFCFFNSVAVAVEHARRQGLRRVAVVDFDVHHGNGTQKVFYADPDVLFISTHQSPLYPGSGMFSELGVGPGIGATVNVPLPGGTGDDVYEAIYGGLIRRMLEQFKPELILVSAGFDCMAGDPLGGMALTADGLTSMMAHLVVAADDVCEGRIALLLEGGYDLPNLAAGVLTCLDAMTNRVSPELLSLDALGIAARGLPGWRRAFTL